ncbi:MAG: Uma2 family endonuclease [Bacteroidetes bacterium]|nr:MAG: Uma2 family endonuclease [Bacteroidota bacterium]
MITDINQLDLTKQYTYADYSTWMFKDRVELLKGWLHRMSPAPLDRHQQIVTGIMGELLPFFKRRPCQVRTAPYDVRLPDSRKSTADNTIFTVVQPDLCIICDPAKIDRRGCIGAPDWIIEILSPGNSKTEMQTKYELYQEAGVLEYWIVQPEHESVLVFALQNAHFQLVKMYTGTDAIPSVLFPELHIRLEEVF